MSNQSNLVTWLFLLLPMGRFYLHFMITQASPLNFCRMTVGTIAVGGRTVQNSKLKKGVHVEARAKRAKNFAKSPFPFRLQCDPDGKCGLGECTLRGSVLRLCLGGREVEQDDA